MLLQRSCHGLLSLSVKKTAYMESSGRQLERGKMGPFNVSLVFLDLL